MDLKYRKRVTTSIDKELYEAFRGLSDKMRVNQSKLFDEALTDLLKKYEVEIPAKDKDR